MTDFSHINKKQQPGMVNVTSKKVTRRKAIAKAIIELPADVMKKLLELNFNTAKGSIIQTAIIAGIMAAKKTGDLIPLCHPIGLENCEVDIQFDENQSSLSIFSTAEVESKTGVEMEALTAVSIAALTIYDMCKALSHDIIIREIKLIEKTGGKNDFKRAE